MAYSTSIKKLLNLYEKERKHQRLGQFFVNNYVKYSWPELFYEEDEEKALNMIQIYLNHYQYTEELPMKIER